MKTKLFSALIIFVALLGLASSAMTNPLADSTPAYTIDDQVSDTLKTDAKQIIINDDLTELKKYIVGDVNLDRKIDINDINFLIDYKFREGPAPVLQYTADVNSDGIINLLDIMALKDLFEPAPTEVTLPEFELGDVNQDGKLDVYDVYFLIDYKFKDGEEPKDLTLADLNQDEIINLLDILKLIDYLKDQGIIVNFQIGDVNQDGKLDVYDVYFLIDYKFREGEMPNPTYLGDFNKDGITNLLDILELIDYLKDNNLLDNTAPTITLSNPADGKIYRTSNRDKDILFEFSFKDESQVQSCELIINREVYKTFDESTTSGTHRVTVNLDRDDYTWKVSCTDIYGNKGFSEIRDFEIKRRSSHNNNNDYVYTPTTPRTNPVTPTIPENTDTIELNPQTKENKAEFVVEYLLPLFLIFCIILVIILIFAASRRN